MTISAKGLYFKELNEKIRAAEEDVVIQDCCGQRYIGNALKGKNIEIYGTPGNALGSFLDGATITVHGNAQDATGDTMNDGVIVVHGNAGDTLGYAMRGGKIFVKGDAGYRTGIHMKQYKDKKPVIVVGGKTGSFLGEYLAGGLIIVLGLGCEDAPVGNFTGTGMHGGRMFIRTDKELKGFPAQVVAEVATDEDKKEIAPYVEEFAKIFGFDAQEILKSRFLSLKPNAHNPYKQLYTAN
ncbi:MAG TPA: glutamate synthase [Clostridia bacterium]|jgi:glutamate synthase domain-containing protein 3|nr:glutamate synthase [Clostridia bacterium]HOL60870.1 glutamate synthase [Clostridia bacterium]HPO53624.1 glutamate synthase [Clostridia bacterium]